MYYGIAMGADLCYHMDGGYHPGGSWMDNQLSFNPPHDISDYKINRGHNIVHPSAFRVSGKLANNFITGVSNENIATLYEDEFIVVDATRCQNGEELATILGQSINEFPGSSAIQSILSPVKTLSKQWVVHLLLQWVTLCVKTAMVGLR